MAVTKVVDIPAPVAEKSNKQVTKQGKAASNKNEPKPADFDEGNYYLTLLKAKIPNGMYCSWLGNNDNGKLVLQVNGFKWGVLHWPKRIRRSALKLPLLLPLPTVPQTTFPFLSCSLKTADYSFILFFFNSASPVTSPSHKKSDKKNKVKKSAVAATAPIETVIVEAAGEEEPKLVEEPVAVKQVAPVYESPVVAVPAAAIEEDLQQPSIVEADEPVVAVVVASVETKTKEKNNNKPQASNKKAAAAVKEPVAAAPEVVVQDPEGKYYNSPWLDWFPTDTWLLLFLLFLLL